TRLPLLAQQLLRQNRCAFLPLHQKISISTGCSYEDIFTKTTNGFQKLLNILMSYLTDSSCAVTKIHSGSTMNWKTFHSPIHGRRVCTNDQTYTKNCKKPAHGTHSYHLSRK